MGSEEKVNNLWDPTKNRFLKQGVTDLIRSAERWGEDIRVNIEVWSRGHHEEGPSERSLKVLSSLRGIFESCKS